MSLYNFSVAPGENSQIPNVCASGYVKNNSSTAIATFVIYSERNATLNKTLSPQQAFNFTNLYILRILNTSADSSCILDVIFSDTSAFSATESESVIQLGSLGSSLGNIPIEIAANSLGNIPISIDATNITGNIPIEIVANSLGNIPITIAASTITSLPIEIVANSLTSLPIQIVSLGSTLGNIPIEIAANSIGNIPIEIASNSLGNIPITLAANTVGNLTIDIAAQSVGNLNTDIGNFSTDLQENQTSGTNTLTYNPWGFSTSVNPAVLATGSTFRYCMIQQNGAAGYPIFYFNVINPTSSSASANITVYLYDHLPEGGPSTTPINQFTFSTGTLAAGAQVWVTVQPNIYWAYNTLAVIPQVITGTGGSEIGVVLPASANYIDAHFWNGTYWNSLDYGFVGFWSITNTAPASLPVAVTNPIKVSEGNAASVISSTKTSNAIIGTVPNGKKWKILRAYITITASSTATWQASIAILPNGTSSNTYENLAYVNVSATINDVYNGIGTITGNIGVTYGNNVQVQMWSDYPILYAGDAIAVFNNNGLTDAYKYMVWYVESDI